MTFTALYRSRICISLHVYTYMCVYIYIYIYIHTHIHVISYYIILYHSICRYVLRRTVSDLPCACLTCDARAVREVSLLLSHYMCIYIYIYIYIYICREREIIYIYIYIYIHIYIYIEREREIDTVYHTLRTYRFGRRDKSFVHRLEAARDGGRASHGLPHKHIYIYIYIYIHI